MTEVQALVSDLLPQIPFRLVMVSLSQRWVLGCQPHNIGHLAQPAGPLPHL